MNELPAQNFLDAALRLRIFFGTHKLDELMSLYPTKSNEQLITAAKRVDKLLDDAIDAVREYHSERSRIFGIFRESTKEKFPEFGQWVIARYLSWAESKYIIGMSYDKELTDQKLLSMGVYDAAALLDKRANLRRPKLPPNHRDTYPLPTLVDLFPHLATVSNELDVVLRRVEELAEYCLSTAGEQRSQYDHFYGEKCKVMKTVNPGFSEASYSEALDNARKRLR